MAEQPREREWDESKHPAPEDAIRDLLSRSGGILESEPQGFVQLSSEEVFVLGSSKFLTSKEFKAFLSFLESSGSIGKELVCCGHTDVPTEIGGKGKFLLFTIFPNC